jgi:protein-disulfide isomerase
MRTRFLLWLAISVAVSDPQSPSAPPRGEAVADINGEAISAAELIRAVGYPLARLEEQAYALKQQKLQEMIGDRLIAQEARRRGITVEALVVREIASKVAPVTPADIHAFYEANKSQLPNPESALADQIRTYLENDRQAAARREFVKALQSKAQVAVLLAAPPPYRVEVPGDGPSRGPATAPVTVVVFEDFQCPFCRQAHETLERVLARYQDRVRLVHRDFPLEALHPAAWKAHEAARCAEKQGKFWEYRSLLYATPRAVSPEDLNGYAGRLGLDTRTFSSCLAGGELKAVVQRDEDAGNALGLTGTPALFINGRFVPGAQPESEYVRIIEEEAHRDARR